MTWSTLGQRRGLALGGGEDGHRVAPAVGVLDDADLVADAGPACRSCRRRGSRPRGSRRRAGATRPAGRACGASRRTRRARRRRRARSPPAAASCRARSSAPSLLAVAASMSRQHPRTAVAARPSRSRLALMGRLAEAIEDGVRGRAVADRDHRLGEIAQRHLDGVARAARCPSACAPSPRTTSRSRGSSSPASAARKSSASTASLNTDAITAGRVGVDLDRGLAVEVDGVEHAGGARALEGAADLLDGRHESGPEDGRGAIAGGRRRRGRRSPVGFTAERVDGDLGEGIDRDRGRVGAPRGRHRQRQRVVRTDGRQATSRPA